MKGHLHKSEATFLLQDDAEAVRAPVAGHPAPESGEVSAEEPVRGGSVTGWRAAADGCCWSAGRARRGGTHARAPPSPSPPPPPSPQPVRAPASPCITCER